MSANRDKLAPKIEGGKNCPRCGNLMQRYEHSKHWRPLPGRYHFAYWDICKLCPHTQNYNEARRDFRALIEKPQQKRQKTGLQRFYMSWDWKQIRYEFLKEKNRRCGCCGASADDGVRIVVDHIKPIRYYWHLRLDKTNLQILCDCCNMGKGSRDHSDFRDMSNIVEFTAPERKFEGNRR